MSVAKLRALGLLLAGVIFAVDRWIKAQVMSTWGLTTEGASIELLPFFNLTRANNYGVSLGMLTASSQQMRWLLVAGTSAIALMVLVWLLRERRGWDIGALGLILGGAMGNIFDRFAYGFVVDYADLHFGTFRPFLIFNLADAAITVGVVIILARALFMREKPPAPHGDAHVPHGQPQADLPAENS